MSGAPTPEEQRDECYMRRALELAARGLHSADPNPRVGCLLVRGDRIVGEGWHERVGSAHAELNALTRAGAAAAGCTAYVTLEPCSHFGHTPPCAEALIHARVARVVYATDDPNPLVRGAGVSALREAGIELHPGVLAEEARALNPGFFKRMERGLPWVRVKLASSLDARTALADGASQWITGPQAREDVQRYRARSSAIMTSSATALADDPTLNVRLPGTVRQPLRVLLDSRLRVPQTARLFGSQAATLVFTASTDVSRRVQLEHRGVRIEQAPPAAAGGGLALEPILRRLAELQVNELWVEAGAVLGGALLEAGLVDELIVYVAPCLLGPQARPLLQLAPIRRLEQRRQLRFQECVRIGEDLRLSARPVD